jgi:hypothetical protein
MKNCFELLSFWKFGFVSNFEIRISYLNFFTEEMYGENR